MRDKGIVEVKKKMGVALGTILLWCDRGLPHDEGFKGTKKVKKFNIEEVEQWIKEQREKV